MILNVTVSQEQTKNLKVSGVRIDPDSSIINYEPYNKEFPLLPATKKALKEQFLNDVASIDGYVSHNIKE